MVRPVRVSANERGRLSAAGQDEILAGRRPPSVTYAGAGQVDHTVEKGRDPANVAVSMVPVSGCQTDVRRVAASGCRGCCGWRRCCEGCWRRPEPTARTSRVTW